MGIRIVIEYTGADDATPSDTSGKVEFYEPDSPVDKRRLGQLLGYAINAVSPILVPGDVIAGIRETIDSD